MKRKAAPRPAPRAPERVAAPAAVDPAGIGVANEPDRPGIEQARQRVPAAVARAAQTDIERADERKPGSIEAVPAPAQAPANHIAGFVEPAGEGDGGDDSPP